MPNLLDLPDELLLDIAHSTRRQHDQGSLCNLSLTNRRLQGISQDVLYHSPTIRIHRSRHLVTRILIHPELAHKIVCLNVLDKLRVLKQGEPDRGDIDMAISRNEPRLGGEVHEPSEQTIQLINILGTSIRAKGLKDDSMRWTAGLQDYDPYAWFAALIVLVPKLKRLTLSNFITRTVGRRRERRGGSSTHDLRPYLTNILHHVAQSVHSFTVGSFAPNFVHYKYGGWRFSPIPWVKHVDIPMNILDLNFNRTLSKQDLIGLPRHMETLQIRDCDKVTPGALVCLGMLIRDHAYVSLKSVEAHWSPPPLLEEREELGVRLDSIRAQYKIEGVNLKWSWGIIFKL